MYITVKSKWKAVDSNSSVYHVWLVHLLQSIRWSMEESHSVCHKPNSSTRFNRHLEDSYRDDQRLLKYWGIMYTDEAEALNYFGQV